MGWQETGDGPALAVFMTVVRVDRGDDEPELPFFNWSLAADGSAPAVDAESDSGFQPDLASAQLRPGDSVDGYVQFDTPATAGVLRLGNGLRYGGPAVATWRLPAATPATAVTGVLGAPVQPQIGAPPVTVALIATGRVDGTDDGVLAAPSSGSYLTATIRVTAADTDRSVGVRGTSFVAVPAGGVPVAASEPGTYDGETTIVVVQPGQTDDLVLAFDAPPGPGTIEMRDAAGRTMVAWPIA